MLWSAMRAMVGLRRASGVCTDGTDAVAGVNMMVW
jgi:hypothetical protein